MKKIFLTLLISSLSLTAFAKPNYSYTVNQTPVQSQNPTPVQQPAQQNSNNWGTYVNEEITTPITKIGLLEDYVQPQVEEKGLEIAWNEWHARVRNKLMDTTPIPKESAICFFYKVDNNRIISDIVIVYAPKSSLLLTDRTFRPNSPIYVYVRSTNKYYKAIVPNASYKTAVENVPALLKASEYNEVAQYTIPYFTSFSEMVSKINSLNNNKILQYPNKSKRTIVKVSQSITNIDEIKGGRYKAENYNDIERQ